MVKNKQMPQNSGSIENRNRAPVWKIICWIAVLPVAVTIYTLTATALIGVADLYSIFASDIAAYAVLFAIATLAAVFIGSLTAPTHRFQTAFVLILLLVGAFAYLTAHLVLSGIRDTSLPPVVLSQIAAGLVATLLIWWNERRATTVKQT